MNIEMNDSFQVYKSWTESQVTEALCDFNNAMHNGAEPEELSAGLLCFDFLTRRSDLSDTLLSRIDAAIYEARVRIELISQKDAEDLSEKEIFDKSARILRACRDGIRNVQRLVEDAKGMEPEYIMARVKEISKAR